MGYKTLMERAQLHAIVSNARSAQAALRGGADVIQLRDKEASDRAFWETARDIRARTREKGRLFLVNDRLHIALAVDADGVHLGPEDLPADAARRLLGRGKILGVSSRTAQSALRARDAGADYLGTGPVFPTRSKPGAPEAIGPDGLRDIVRATELPVVAIGGITWESVREVLRCGVRGVAVLSAIRENTEDAVRRIRKELDRAEG